jgi:gamma-D-glutamyl-L-lysine dipeptidyl-peptidase
MKYGVIIRNVTDLRSEPKFRSERKSQLLYNDPVEIGQGHDGYLWIVQEDGYSGWVTDKAVFLLGRKKFQDHINSYNYQISANFSSVLAPKDTQCPPFLFYGTRIPIIDSRNNQSAFPSVNGEILKISDRNLQAIALKTKKDLMSRAILKKARSFMGVPYLWGGITPFGFDCSGLVQMIYQVEAGIRLPRDSKDQKALGIKINKEEVQAGDLRFFKGHVAIAIDRFKIIHSSLAGGGVVINSLNPKDADFRSDLPDIHVEDRRIIL